MTVQAVIEHVQAAIAASSGTKVKYAPNYPTDASISTVTSTCWGTRMRYYGGADNQYLLFDLHVRIMYPRAALEDVMQSIAGIPLAVADIIRADVTIGSHAQTCGEPITADLIAIPVDGIDHIGYDIVVPDVKLYE